MPKAAIPSNEQQRLASLHRLGVVYTPPEERYDRITRLASRLLNAPIALVSLIDERVQWFKSSQGLETTETPREIAFCSHAILNEDTFVVEDALTDERFRDNPLVQGEPGIRFYAGHPVRAADGMPVGTLCVIGREPRTFDASERAMLRDLAAFVEAELQRDELNDSQRKWLLERDELVKKASIDSLTRAWNRGEILQLLGIEVSRAKRGTPLSVALIDIDQFKLVNDTYGHQTGDHVITEVAARIRAAVRDFDLFGRYGGEEFLIVLGNCSEGIAADVCERIRANIALTPMSAIGGAEVPVTVSIGIAHYGPLLETSEKLVAVADVALYRAKAGGRNRIELGSAEDQP
jgi:diguanylate cyclase (GGDEF)-like protein